MEPALCQLYRHTFVPYIADYQLISTLLYALIAIYIDAAWSVCLCVCWTRPKAVLKRLNRSRYRLECGLGWAQGTSCWVEARISPRKGQIWGLFFPTGNAL